MPSAKDNLVLLDDLKAELSACSAHTLLDFEFFYNFRSPHTRRAYKIDLGAFFSFINELSPGLKDLAAIERFHLVAYREWMDKQKLAPKTLNRRLSSVSSYFDFMVEKGKMPFNPCQSIKRPRQEVQNPTIDLSDDEVVQLMEALKKETPSAPLHRAVIYLLFSTGIRKSELINLRVGDFTFRDDHWQIRVIAKGGKQLEKLVHPVCAEIMQAYLDWKKSQGFLLCASDALFTPTRNPAEGNGLEKHLNPKSVDYIIKNWCTRAGILKRISPHSARATYIGSALEAGEDIYRVSRDVGHASVQTTQIYDKRRRQIKESPAHSLGYFKKIG